MPRPLILGDNGFIEFKEARANGLAGVTVDAPANLTAGGGAYAIELPDALPVGTEFLTISAAGKLATSAGSAVVTLDAAYNGGSVITADAGPVEAAGAGGFLASHSAPVYGLETTGLERNYRITAGQTAGILEIQVGDADADISDDVFATMLAIDGGNQRLGFGTAAPVTLAHFVGPVGLDAVIRLDAPVGMDAAVTLFEDGVSRWKIGYDDSAGGLVVGRLSFANPTIFVEDTTGDVGIGTVAPARKLHVIGSSVDGIQALIEATQPNAALAFKASGTTDDLQVRVEAVDNDMRLYAGAGTALMHLDGADARVGVGTTTPAAKLEVISNVAAQIALLVNQDANGIGLSIDSEATAAPLLELLPLADTNARGDIAFGQRTAGASAPAEGDVWYNATDHRLEFYHGTATRSLGTRFGPAFGPSEVKVIAAGVITATSGYMFLTSEAGTADTLDTIAVTGAGPKVGDTIFLRNTATHVITLAHGTGNLRLDADAAKVLNNMDHIVLFWTGTNWRQLTQLMQITT